MVTTSSARTKQSRRRGIVISVGVVVVASVVVAVMMLMTRPLSPEVPHTASDVTLTGASNDHAGMTGSSPSPAGSRDMPGMSPEEHGSGDVPDADHGSGDMPGMSPEHGKTADEVQDRPLAPVLGTFGGATSAVLLTAGFLRRKDRARGRAKLASRAARRTQR